MLILIISRYLNDYSHLFVRYLLIEKFNNYEFY